MDVPPKGSEAEWASKVRHLASVRREGICLAGRRIEWHPKTCRKDRCFEVKGGRPAGAACAQPRPIVGANPVSPEMTRCART